MFPAAPLRGAQCVASTFATAAAIQLLAVAVA